MAAEREVGRTNSVRMIGAQLGSDFSGAKAGIPLGPRGHPMIKSSGSALSPAGYGQQLDQFNIQDYQNDIENQELNEEIKKLLLENQF